MTPPLLYPSCADLSVTDASGSTPLHYAARQGSAAMVLWLVAHGPGVVVDATDLHGVAAVDALAVQGRGDTVAVDSARRSASPSALGDVPPGPSGERVGCCTLPCRAAGWASGWLLHRVCVWVQRWGCAIRWGLCCVVGPRGNWAEPGLCRLCEPPRPCPPLPVAFALMSHGSTCALTVLSPVFTLFVLNQAPV